MGLRFRWQVFVIGGVDQPDPSRDAGDRRGDVRRVSIQKSDAGTDQSSGDGENAESGGSPTLHMFSPRNRVILLPYNGGTIVKVKRLRSRTAIAKSRSKPEIFVRIKAKYDWQGSVYAKASIRVKAGEYQYLTWRDGGQVRTFYLGRKRKS
jgi:hypothetical protein